MKEDIKHAQETLKKIESMENMVSEQMFNTQYVEETNIKININPKLRHGVFLPVSTNVWEASEQTFRAMKKNIFALGESVDDLMEPYTCESCKSDLDIQFWHFCPYCGESFK